MGSVVLTKAPSAGSRNECGIVRGRIGVLRIVVGFAIGAASASADPIHANYTDWLGWARLDTTRRAGLASSYDRSGGNADYNHYESPAGLVLDPVPAIIKTIIGPGFITRFWMPHRTANQSFVVKLFFDGETTPRIDTTSDVLFAGNYSYFTPPFVDTSAGGQVSHEMIPFAQSVRIETFNHESQVISSTNRHYYQYTYVTFPGGAPLSSYSGTLTPAEQTARNDAANLFANVGQHPAGPDPNAVVTQTPGQLIPPGASKTILDHNGPGLIRRMSIRMDGASDEALDGLRLSATYDCHSLPAIDVPIGQFFGAGHNRAAYRSLPIGTDSPDGFYCYWPMPFRHRARIELRNTTSAPIDIDEAAVEFVPGPIDNDLCYLHARAESSVRQPGVFFHPILATTGRGHYIGNLLYVEQDAYSFGMLEGDDIVTIDGTDVLYGTGLEDAYSGGYYYNWVAIESDEPEGPMPQSATRPLNGVLYVHRAEGVEFARADQYRWYIADRIAFSNSIDVKTEILKAILGSRWTSVAFWYRHPPAVGDTDDDGDLDAADLATFVAVLLGADTDPDHVWISDVNKDCAANGSDVAGFIDAMIGG